MALNHYILVRTFFLDTELILVAEQMVKIGAVLKLLRSRYYNLGKEPCNVLKGSAQRQKRNSNSLYQYRTHNHTI